MGMEQLKYFTTTPRFYTYPYTRTLTPFSLGKDLWKKQVQERVKVLI
jgi:hypothetical protein